MLGTPDLISGHTDLEGLLSLVTLDVVLSSLRLAGPRPSTADSALMDSLLDRDTWQPDEREMEPLYCFNVLFPGYVEHSFFWLLVAWM